MAARKAANGTQTDRVEALQQALARFSPPQYTLEQRAAVERRVVELSKICDEALAIRTRSRSAGASSAGSGQLRDLAERTASSDPVLIGMYVSATHAVSVSTLIRWVSRYKRLGPSVFVPRPQTLRPEIDERFLDIPPAAIDWLRANYRSYARASITKFGKAWLKTFATDCTEKNDSHRSEKTHSCFSEKAVSDQCQSIPSVSSVAFPFSEFRPGKRGSCYSWLYRWVRSIPAAARTFALEGERGVENKFAYIKRDYSEFRPRDAWVMDWRISDVPCWLPARAAGGVPRLAREWLCPVFDIASRAVFGFRWDDRPNARGITLAYLDAIGESEWKSEPGLEMLRGMQRSRPGFEAFLLWDNGKDFRARDVEGREIEVRRFDVETGLSLVINSYQIGLAPEMQIRVRHAKPFNAKSKIVEGWFGYAMRPWEQTLPGWQGGTPDEKPFYWPAAYRLHQAFCKRRSGKSADVRVLPPSWREQFERTEARYGCGTPFLSQTEHRAAFLKFLLEYLQTSLKPLSDELGELSPIQFLNQCADPPHMLSDLATMALAMPARVVTVRRGEISIRMQGETFIYREIPSEISDGVRIAQLPDRTQVEVRYHPDQVGRLLVMGQGGPIAWCEQPELMRRNATSADFEAANKRKKQIRIAAQSFFDVRTSSSDWRDEADRRSNVVELKRAVGAEDLTADDTDSPHSAFSTVPEIPVITRFDRAKRGSRLTLAESTQVPGDDAVASVIQQSSGLSSQEPETSDDLILPWEI